MKTTKEIKETTEQTETTEKKKHSTSEGGDIKIVNNLDEMNSIIDSMGATYAPTNTAIAKTALTAKKTAGTTVMLNAGTGLVAYKNAVNARDDNYKKMGTLSTRILAALKSCGAKPDIIKDATGIKKDIDGVRVGKKPADPKKAHSVSHQGFDQRLGHFLLLIALVGTEPKYNPNEADLKVAALIAYASSLQPMNKTVDNALAEKNRLMDLVNVELYAPVTGIVALSKLVKEYVKSVVGARSPIYKRIAGLQFRNKEI